MPSYFRLLRYSANGPGRWHLARGLTIREGCDALHGARRRCGLPESPATRPAEPIRIGDVRTTRKEYEELEAGEAEPEPVACAPAVLEEHGRARDRADDLPHKHRHGHHGIDAPASGRVDAAR
jgi:hypothetical protein